MATIQQRPSRTKTVAPPLPDGVALQTLSIPALEDEWALGALRFTSKSCDEAQENGRLGAAVVIAPVTGVAARFYSHFAGWLASRGHPTTVFDYRMNGASYPTLSNPAAVPKGKNNDSASYTASQRIQCLHAQRSASWVHYAERDMPAVLLSAREHAGTASKRDLVVVGNSLGCHCTPPALAKLDAIGKGVDCKRVLFLGPTSGYVQTFQDPPSQADLFASWAEAGQKLGYGPTREWGMGNDIPLAALEDWVSSIESLWLLSLVLMMRFAIPDEGRLR